MIKASVLVIHYFEDMRTKLVATIKKAKSDEELSAHSKAIREIDIILTKLKKKEAKK